MRQWGEELEVATRGRGLIEITDRVVAWVRDSSRAAARPEMPEPTIATFTRPSVCE